MKFLTVPILFVGPSKPNISPNLFFLVNPQSRFSLALGAMGFQHLPSLYWWLLALTLVCYTILTQFVKTWLFSKHWI
jgi:Mg2+-importing ATPase